jgi:hypothetical protein
MTKKGIFSKKVLGRIDLFALLPRHTFLPAETVLLQFVAIKRERVYKEYSLPGGAAVFLPKPALGFLGNNSRRHSAWLKESTGKTW